MPAISSSDSFVILVKIGPNLLRLGLSKSKTLQVLQQGKEKRDQAIKQGSLQPAAREGLFKDLLAAWQNANRICLKDASVSCYQNLIDAHILPELGNKRMHQINASTINRFLFMKLEWGRLDGTGGLSPPMFEVWRLSLVLQLDMVRPKKYAHRSCLQLQSRPQ